MSHFYRLLTKNNMNPGDMHLHDIVCKNDTDKMITDFASPRLEDEIALSPPWLGIKMHKASMISADKAEAFTFDMGTSTMPDILGWGSMIIMSAKAKAIVQAFDDFPHQFYETALLADGSKKSVVQEPYYIMRVCRVLQMGFVA